MLTQHAPCSPVNNAPKCHTTVLLNTSRAGDSISALGNTCLITFQGSFPSYPALTSLGATWGCSLSSSVSGARVLPRCPLLSGSCEPHFLQSEPPQLPQPLPMGDALSLPVPWGGIESFRRSMTQPGRRGQLGGAAPGGEDDFTARTGGRADGSAGPRLMQSPHCITHGHGAGGLPWRDVGGRDTGGGPVGAWQRRGSAESSPGGRGHLQS